MNHFHLIYLVNLYDLMTFQTQEVLTQLKVTLFLRCASRLRGKKGSKQKEITNFLHSQSLQTSKVFVALRLAHEQCEESLMEGGFTAEQLRPSLCEMNRCWTLERCVNVLWSNISFFLVI